MESWVKLVSMSAVLLFLCVVYSYAWEEAGDYYPLENSYAVEKRYYMSKSCRRCIHSPSDTYSCALCYNVGRGPIPYYGKRSFEAPYEEEDAGYGDIITAAKRGSFLACKCCNSVRSADCCYACGFFPSRDPFFRRRK